MILTRSQLKSIKLSLGSLAIAVAACYYMIIQPDRAKLAQLQRTLTVLQAPTNAPSRPISTAITKQSSASGLQRWLHSLGRFSFLTYHLDISTTQHRTQLHMILHGNYHMLTRVLSQLHRQNSQGRITSLRWNQDTQAHQLSLEINIGWEGIHDTPASTH